MNHIYRSHKLKPDKVNCVRKLRIFNNLRQIDLVEKTKIKYQTIRHIESNTRKMTKNEEKKIADALSVKVYQLYEEGK